MTRLGVLLLVALMVSACGGAGIVTESPSEATSSTTTALPTTSSIVPTTEAGPEEPAAADPGDSPAADQSDPEEGPPPTDPPKSEGTAPSRPPVPVEAERPPSETTDADGEVPPDLLALIVADGTERSAGAAMAVLTAYAVTWNDGSLGCPEPGVVYTQALVPGYRVVLTDGTIEYDYRVSASGSFFLCPLRTAPTLP